MLGDDHIVAHAIYTSVICCHVFMFFVLFVHCDRSSREEEKKVGRVSGEGAGGWSCGSLERWTRSVAYRIYPNTAGDDVAHAGRQDSGDGYQRVRAETSKSRRSALIIWEENPKHNIPRQDNLMQQEAC